MPPRGLPLGDAGQAQGRQGHPRRSALHPHDGGRRHPRPDPGRQRHRLPRRPHQLRHQFRALERGALLQGVRHHLHQRRHASSTRTSSIPRTRPTDKPLGVFSGLGPYKEGKWGLNGFVGQYNPESWQYARTAVGDQGRAAATAQSGEQAVAIRTAGRGRAPVPSARRMTRWCDPSKPSPAERDDTLQDPRCVFQLLKKHFARYTPEMVAQVTGCPQEKVVEVAETLLNNSGPDKTSAICYAVGWTQHTYGVQMIGTAATLQLLLGNIGRPGGGIIALRGHATIQGSTDIPTLYHSIHGYMPAPTVLKPHNTRRGLPESGDAADRLLGQHAQVLRQLPEVDVRRRRHRGQRLRLRLAPAHLRRPLAHADDDRHGRGPRARHVRHGAEPRRRRPERALPAGGAGQARLAGGQGQLRDGDRRLLVQGAGGARTAPSRTEDIQTEVFFFPSAQVAEMRRHLHQHAAPDQIPPQGGRSARRLPHRHLVHLSPRHAAEEALRGKHRTARPGASSISSGTTSPTRRRSSPGRSRTSPAR